MICRLNKENKHITVRYLFGKTSVTTFPNNYQDNYLKSQYIGNQYLPSLVSLPTNALFKFVANNGNDGLGTYLLKLELHFLYFNVKQTYRLFPFSVFFY